MIQSISPGALRGWYPGRPGSSGFGQVGIEVRRYSLCIAEVLGLLYSSFPRKIVLNYEFTY